MLALVRDDEHCNFLKLFFRLIFSYFKRHMIRIEVGECVLLSRLVERALQSPSRAIYPEVTIFQARAISSTGQFSINFVFTYSHSFSSSYYSIRSHFQPHARTHVQTLPLSHSQTHVLYKVYSGLIS